MGTNGEHLSGAKRALLERRLRGETNGNSHSRAVTPRGAPEPIPLSVVQEDLWYLSQLAPDNPVYNELVTIRKTGAFNRDAFKRAFNELVRRHEAWRTTFPMMDGQPVQVVQPPQVIDLPVTDLSDSPRRDAEKRAIEMAAELACKPYQLDKGPLLRPLLVRFGEDEHRLYLGLHHLLIDAVGLHRVVLPELAAVYDSFAAGEQPTLAEPPSQYADYARWSQEWAKSEAYARRMAYWRRHLEGAPELQLPLDHPRPRQQRFRGGMECVRLSEDLVRRLRALGLAEGATMFQVFASAFAVLLHHYAAAQDDVVFGIVSDLRRRTEFETVLGYCFNPVVVRANLGGDPSFRQLLGRLRTELLDDLAQQVPFGRLVRDLQPPRGVSINPFFQAMLVLLPPPSSTDSEWSLYQEAKLSNAVGTAKLDLTLQLDERPEGYIDGRLIYNSDLFDAQTAQRVTGNWLTMLECVSNAPERRVSELAVLTHAGIQQPRANLAHDSQVDTTPGTPSGDIDLDALLGPEAATLETDKRFVAPRTSVEERMAAIWARALRMERVGVYDDFFDLGGHSLLVVRLVGEIEREFGVEIPLLSFYEGDATVADFAAVVENSIDGPGSDGSMSNIDPRAAKSVNFFVYPNESSMVTLRHFTRALGQHERVVGLLPERNGARFDQSRSIEDLAAAIRCTLREIQPVGPYRLTGFSMGGLLAYEIASQLTAVGEEVAWLALIDRAPPTFSNGVMRRRLSLPQRLARQRERGLRGALRHTGTVARRETTAALVRLHLRPSRPGDDFDWRGALKIERHYACSGNDVPMHLFPSAAGAAETRSSSLGWNMVHRGPLEVHHVPGDHSSMMREPHVSVLADELVRCLRLALEHVETVGQMPAPTANR